MAGDGLLGNSMFFFLSGFGVALASRSRELGFFPWMLRRISRIYPAVVLSILILDLGIFKQWREIPFNQYPTIFIYPTIYGFVGQVMIVYMLLYWVLKPVSRWPLVVLLLTVSAYSTVLYVKLLIGWQGHPVRALGDPITAPMHWYYFTALGLLGGLYSPTTRRPRATAVRDVLCLAGLFSIYFALKFAMVHGHMQREFFVLFPLSAGICVATARVSAGDELQSLLRKFRPLNQLVTLLAGITLEMYIMQTWTTWRFGFQTLRFPLNIAVFWIATIVSALVLSKLTAWIMPWLSRGHRGLRDQGETRPT
jgi:hypothetical protein